MSKEFRPLLFDKCPYCRRNVYGNSHYVIVKGRCYHKKCAPKVDGRKMWEK